jgi:chemotaxis family two-component system response regulator Rcp1
MRPAQIVVIEDNQADVFLVRLALEEFAIQYALTWFRSGLEAVLTLCGPRAAENIPLPDMILLDLNTPRSEGFEILAKLQQTPRLAQVPIAILTSSRAPADHARAAAYGVRYIEKPSQLQDFLGAVGSAVKGMLAKSPAAFSAEEQRSAAKL